MWPKLVRSASGGLVFWPQYIHSQFRLKKTYASVIEFTRTGAWAKSLVGCFCQLLKRVVFPHLTVGFCIYVEAVAAHICARGSRHHPASGHIKRGIKKEYGVFVRDNNVDQALKALKRKM